MDTQDLFPFKDSTPRVGASEGFESTKFDLLATWSESMDHFVFAGIEPNASDVEFLERGMIDRDEPLKRVGSQGEESGLVA